MNPCQFAPLAPAKADLASGFFLDLALLDVIIRLAGPKQSQIERFLPKTLGAACPGATKNCLEEVMKRKGMETGPNSSFSLKKLRIIKEEAEWQSKALTGLLCGKRMNGWPFGSDFSS
jgi:hypothetical protein